MSAEEVVRAMITSINEGDMGMAADCLSDDFQFSGPVPESLNKTQWVHLQQRLLAAFPDWSFNLTDVSVGENVVTATYRITGTHTGELDLSPMGIPKVPATGKSISLPEEEARCTVKDGRITRIEIDPKPDGGLSGTLNQLGVEISSSPR